MSPTVRLRTVARRSVAWLSLLCCGVAAAGPAGALDIDPGLRERLAAKSAGATFDVYVALDDRLDLEALDRTLAGSAPIVRRRAVIAALRAHAQRSQAETLQQLQSAAQRGQAQRIRSLWLTNGIAFRGGAEAITALANVGTDGTVVEDLTMQLIERVGAGDAVAEARRAGGSARQPAESHPDAAAAEAAARAPDDLVAGGQSVVWSVDYIHAPAVWSLGYDGTGVVVGHFDTGIWMAHPDIAQRLWTNPLEVAGNGLDDDANGYIDDVHGFDFGDRDSDPTDDSFPTDGGGHGTHTAGTVCGDGTGGTATGVAPGAQLMVCKVTLTETGLAATSAILEGWQYALANGAHLLTMSMGVSGPVHGQHLQSQRQAGDAVRVAGIAAFVAAGNARGWWPIPYELSTMARVPSPWHADPATPYTSRSGVIAVGATGYQSDTIWAGSSNGPADWGWVVPYSDWDFATGHGLVKPDVSAPGEAVRSLSRPNGYTGSTWSGTSMACPHAAGVAALLLHKNPTLSPEDIDRVLQQTAVDAGAPGKDNQFGAGRIDALAAINAVPSSQYPSIVIQSLQVVDPGGDGYFEAGESFMLQVDLLNSSKLIDAADVQLTVTSSDSRVVVVDGLAAYGPISAGSVAGNGSDGLLVEPTLGMPRGERFDLLLRIDAAGGFTRTINHRFTVGRPELQTHTTGRVALSVTDRGTLGFWDLDQVEGVGFGKLDGGNGLYIGGLWAGTGPDYLCNRDYVTVDPAEWLVSEIPNGYVDSPDIPLSDQDYIAHFTDSNHAYPRGIQVKQHSMSWNEPGNDGFVVLRYEFFNTGAVPVMGYYAGIFCDFDILYPLINNAAVDPALQLAYTWDLEGNYYGIALLAPSTPAALAVIPNALWSTAETGFTDADKWGFLSGAIPPQDGSAEADYSSLVSAGPFDIPRTRTVEVAFAMVYGDDLAELRANTTAAHAKYAQTPTAARPLPVPADLILAQNVPNPFNPSTTIAFDLPADGPVRLEIYDARGRQVRRLIEQALPSGRHLARWDGTDDAGRRAASGAYFYRLTTARGQLTRKLSLVE